MSEPVVVVGGGITGLAAAHELLGQGRDVVVLEADGRAGGKVHGSAVDGSASSLHGSSKTFSSTYTRSIPICLSHDAVISARTPAWSTSTIRP